MQDSVLSKGEYHTDQGRAQDEEDGMQLLEGLHTAGQHQEQRRQGQSLPIEEIGEDAAFAPGVHMEHGHLHHQKSRRGDKAHRAGPQTVERGEHHPELKIRPLNEMKQPIQLLRVVGMGFKPFLARALHPIRRVAVDQSRLICILQRLVNVRMAMDDRVRTDLFDL